jgi:hypothetical protein
LNSQYQVYFGDNIIGKKLEDGCVVRFEYLVTNGSKTNGANNFISTSTLSGYSNIVVDSVSKAAGGGEKESVDEIKYTAPLSFLSQNRAVTKNDYIRLIQQKYPAFEAVNVWGGEENEPPIYGKIFVAAKPRLGFEVTNTEKEYVKETVLKPISILTVTPEIVDVDYNYLKVESTIFYDPTQTTKTESELKTGVRNTINSFCSTNLNKFNSIFRYSNLETLIDGYDKAIISNDWN